MREVLVEDFTGVATGALAQPDGVVVAVAPEDADRGEQAEGLAYEGDGGAWHGGVLLKRWAIFSMAIESLAAVRALTTKVSWSKPDWSVVAPPKPKIVSGSK